jgi:hypothetical protein
MDRRKFITTSIVTRVSATVASSATNAAGKESVKVLGISCSPRKGKTTATSVRIALDAAKELDPRI